MCGIYGGTSGISDDVLKQKLERINFRGPDNLGIWRNNEVCLGHVRLSIVDLDERSNQPLEKNGLVIVFNGEIYNFLSLKDKLRNEGVTFETTSDTEVVLEMYRAYGEKCLRELNGMFSFAIYDIKEKSFFGGRDRIGKKPFYYTLENGQLEFASQPSQLLIGNNRNLSDNSIGQFLIYGYVPEPNSIFEGIKKLPPGTYFNYKMGSSKFEAKKYWDFDYNIETFEGSYDEAKKLTTDVLRKSVKERLIGDVGVGTFLSGGIDSTLITCLANQESSTAVKAFTMRFGNSELDESEVAKANAKYLGIEHEIIECSPDQVKDLLTDFNYYYDEPFSDSSALPSLLLTQVTSKHVKVALSGDGGDEAFFGYNYFNWTDKAEKLYKIPYFLRKGLLKPLLGALPNYKLNVIAESIGYKGLEGFLMNLFSSHHLKLPSELYIDQNNYKHIFDSNLSTKQKLADLTYQLWLLNDSNVKVDRASMANSMEVRSPLLDYRMIELGRTMPTSYKIGAFGQKHILKDMLNDHLPREYWDRKKSGFTIPLKEWFRTDLKELVMDELNADFLKKVPFLDSKLVSQEIKSHMNGTNNFYSDIWKLLVLKKFINK